LGIVSLLLLTPILSMALTRLARPLLRSMMPIEGSLAADSLIHAPRRTSASVAALTLSLAIVVAFAGMSAASYRSIVDWMNAALNPDLFVLPSPTIVARTLRFPPEMQPQLAAIEGVARVQSVRTARVPFRGTPVMLVAANAALMGETAARSIVAGEASTMYKATADGRGLITSANLAALQRLHVGDMVELATPRGMLSLPIVGIVVDHIDQQGAFLIDRRVFQRYWGDDSLNLFHLYLTPGVAADDVKRRILELYAGERQVFVLSNAEVKGYILGVTDQWFSLTYLQIAVAVLVAVLGVVNTLTVSITDRRRELAILRAVGGLRAQIRRTIWLEAVIIGAIGLALGFGLGAVNLYYILEIVQRDVAGLSLEYIIPGSLMLALVPVILGAAFIAAIWPAESAVRSSLAAALEYE
jgi:putative ABC transport system permease protein